MENLYRRLGESVTKWKFKVLNDEFLVTRIRLTALYTILSVIFLCAFSVVLYESLVSRLDDSVQQAVLDPGVRAVVANQTGDNSKSDSSGRSRRFGCRYFCRFFPDQKNS